MMAVPNRTADVALVRTDCAQADRRGDAFTAASCDVKKTQQTKDNL